MNTCIHAEYGGKSEYRRIRPYSVSLNTRRLHVGHVGSLPHTVRAPVSRTLALPRAPRTPRSARTPPPSPHTLRSSSSDSSESESESPLLSHPLLKLAKAVTGGCSRAQPPTADAQATWRPKSAGGRTALKPCSGRRRCCGSADARIWASRWVSTVSPQAVVACARSSSGVAAQRQLLETKAAHLGAGILRSWWTHPASGGRRVLRGRPPEGRSRGKNFIFIFNSLPRVHGL